MLLAETARRLGAERGTVYSVDATGAATSRVALLPELPGIRLAPGEGAAGWTAREGKAARVSAGDQRLSGRIDTLTGFRTRESMTAPLVSKTVGADGKVVGVIQLLNHSGGGFDDEALGRLVAIAELLGGFFRDTPAPGRASGEPGWVGEATTEALSRLHRAAPTEATVLLRGESGTGKELAARLLHDRSPRRARPFVVVDCAALPPHLLENELFGHVRGAFTGADRDAEGKVHAAVGGTLFLDEIGELPLPVQGRLLRLLQERTFHRVGGARPENADVRFVAATWRDLEEDVRAGRFRADLYWRLRVVEVRLPPLRERGSTDLNHLIDHYVAVYAHRHGRPAVYLDAAARAALHTWTWPGNVRELQHCLESAVVLTPGNAIGVEALPLPGQSGQAPPESIDLASIETAHIQRVLDACGGNRSEAARLLHIGRNTLLRRLRER